MENSKIAWTDHTWNPWRGCTKVSPGCANCYAETMSHRNPAVLGEWGPGGTRVLASEAKWKEPHRWDKKARAEGIRRRVFCASLADVFEDRPELRLWRERMWETIRQCPNLDWLILTKRPEGFATMLPWSLADVAKPWPHVWLGVSIEDQTNALNRIPPLLATPAAVRFLSVEPLLGPVDLLPWLAPPCGGDVRSGHLCRLCHAWTSGIDWVIVGGESGPNFRPMDHAWARVIRDQCAAAGVPFFFKQSAALYTERGIELDGEVVREYPTTRRLPLTLFE